VAPMKGKWAQGITPRNFVWVLKDRLAVAERPGGYGANHRRVRRQEEIIWIREQGFTRVISLIAATHNLHNYDELGVAWLHRPMRPTDEPVHYQAALYDEVRRLLAAGEKLLIHREEVGDAVCGLVAGYLLWASLVPYGPQAISVTERLTSRQLGPEGRALVANADLLRTQKGQGSPGPSAPPGAPDAPAPAGSQGSPGPSTSPGSSRTSHRQGTPTT
jgi:hypothetical protein